jgi:phosphatidylglycerophosphatase A
VPRAEIALGPRDDWGGNVKIRDQNQIVIDEVLGMLITCNYLRYLQVSQLELWLLLFIGFVFFRFFDIVKIPPTKYFDRMKNPAGVMLDDFVAGVYACLSLGFVIALFL